MSSPTINPQDAQAKLAQAQAQGVQAQTQLEQALAAQSGALAQAQNAASDLGRYRSLQATNPQAVAQQQVDQALATDRNARAQVTSAAAQVAGAKAQIKTVEAQIATAQINLGYTQITAPVDGHVTQRSAAPGNYVTPGQDLMTIVPLQLWVTANFKETQLDLDAAGPGGNGDGGCLQRHADQRPYRFHPARRRPSLRHPAAGKRHRQLRQGGPARAGENPARQGAQGLHLGSRHERRAFRQGALMVNAADHGWTPERSVAGKHNPWTIIGVISIATFMVVLDSSIANVSLGHIAGSLSASYDEAAWVLTSFLVANAIVIPISGWLADVFGRKRYYMFSVALFTLSSLLCGMAPTLPFLIIARILQGIGGGGLAPVEQSMMADTFPPSKRGAAFAVYGVVVIVGPILGPSWAAGSPTIIPGTGCS